MTHLLAERHGLTLYDAAYLELAQRLDLPLATLDNELRWLVFRFWERRATGLSSWRTLKVMRQAIDYLSFYQ